MARILLIGASRERTQDLRSLLRQDGHAVTWERRPELWRERERELGTELVVAAVEPGERLPAAAARAARGFPAPLLFVQRESDLGGERRMEERLVDRISSPFVGEEFLGRVDALVRVQRVVHGGSGRGDEERPGGRFGSWLRARLPRVDKPAAPYLEVAARVAEWADTRDAFKPGHAERVASFASLIAGTLGLPEAESSALLRAALLHDIGKVALPIEILQQRTPLDESQRRLIRTHPARGAALLRALDPDEGLARMVLYHHECPNGTGYYGKDATAVPRGAFVLAVAEAYDAMTSSLVQEPMPPPQALATLRSLKGERYDAAVVEALADGLKPRGGSVPLSLA